jgi:hypothetical protein
MDPVNNIVAFHLQIDNAVKSIMKDGKIDQNDIPTLVLLITNLISTPQSSKLTLKELGHTINELFNYIMSHYKLFPDDLQQQAAFKSLFDMCVKLVLFQPNVIELGKKCKSWFSCF